MHRHRRIGRAGRLEIELGLAGGAGPREWSPGGPCGRPGWWCCCRGCSPSCRSAARPAPTAFDPASLTAPFGYFGNLLAAPFARWDSVWYLAIAQGGYDHEATRTAFFPIYPLLLRGVGLVIGSDLIAGVRRLAGGVLRSR